MEIGSVVLALLVLALAASGVKAVSYYAMPAVATPERKQLAIIEQPERTDHPTWGKKKWNGHATLIEGVWVDDFDRPRPSVAQLRQFRHDYLKRTRVETYTIVEGEQMAPMGRDGRMIKIRATTSRDGASISDANGRIREYIPCIQITSLEPNEWWASSSFGTLPATYTLTVDR